MPSNQCAVIGLVVLVATLVLALPAGAPAQETTFAGSDVDLFETTRSAVCLSGNVLPLRVTLAISSPSAQRFRDVIRDEITAIWQRHDVALRWIESSALRGSLDDGVLRLVVQDGELPLADAKALYTVGWIRFLGGRPQNLVRVSTRAALGFVTRFIARRFPSAIAMEDMLQIDRFRDAFGRLIAWSLAHEIGHYVLATPRHTKAGLMRTAFSPDDLIDAREAAVSLSPVDAHRLAARHMTQPNRHSSDESMHECLTPK